jgi:4-amino-4-deoxy-L-arabinose transferase-like glycosyltransferase
VPRVRGGALRGNAALRWGLVVFAFVLILLAIDIWWVGEHRSGYPLDIDEAGYTTFAYTNYLALHFQGINGWWESIQHQSTFAPLLTAVTSLALHFDLSASTGFVVLALFAAVLAFAAYLLAQLLVEPRLAALAAIVTATLPGTFGFAREYIFALPTATFLLISVYAILRSDGLRKWPWALGGGFAIGLMLLSRSMAITYVPGILLAGIVPMFLRAGGVSTGRRLLNLLLLAVVGAVVAATWYARNIGSVIEYLTSYGYGDLAKAYGTDHGLLSWGRFRGVFEGMISEDLFVPIALVVLAALALLAVATALRLRPHEGRGQTLRRIVASDAFGVCIVFIVGYGALMTSQNGGDGFTLPLSVLLPSIGVVALSKFPKATVPAVVVVSVIALFNVISTADIWKWAAQERDATIPLLYERLPITKGVPKVVAAIRVQSPGPEFEFGHRDSLWLNADRKLAAIIVGLSGPNGEPPLVAFASRSWDLNTNTVQLAAVQAYQRGLPMGQFQIELESEDTVAHYRELLEAGVTVLITMSTEEDDFPPTVTQAKAEAAARQLNFRRVDSMNLPNGRKLWVWQKQS